VEGVENEFPFNLIQFNVLHLDVNHETIQLDKLCDSMTDYYKQHPRSKGGEGSFAVGDNVAAPFADDRM